MKDSEYMKLALELATKGQGKVSPNPMVGAVIVKDEKILGKGYHEKFGGFHAEINAIHSCDTKPAGATLYVTLEPCCHYGKTPPCTKAIIENGISKVVVGHKDPNPLMSGKGISMLKEAGIEVIEGVLEEECAKLNEVFFYYIKTKLPYVNLKYAMTLDGKTATYTGASKWITGDEARKKVHKDRQCFTAIMTGIGTVLADDPMLTSHEENGRNPIRIICDTNLRTPIASQIVQTAKTIPTIIATSSTDTMKHKAYIDAGCDILIVSMDKQHLNLTELLTLLGNKGIDSIYLEGGETLNWSFLERGLVNKVQAYIAPKLFGGSSAKTPIGGIGADLPNNGFSLINTTITTLGLDYLMEGEVINSCLQD